jgi:MoaA/NifB/PqqE/SkfB family radical SAM enzyme
MTIGFTGGEPLVRADIVDLVAAVGEDCSKVIFSTGYNLDSKLAVRLHDVGLDCMTIGMESDKTEEHDAVRGVKGSYDTAIGAIETSLGGGLYTSISTIGSREKLKNGTLERMAEMATRYGVHEFRILEPVPTGSFSGNTAEVLTAAESGELAAFHKQWNRRGLGPSIACFAYLESDEMFGCGAGYHHLFIDALGNVCPCDLTPLAMGNVLEESLCDIWARMAEWFERPRCGCLMKKLCAETDALRGVTEFPVCREKSEGICTQLKRGDRLPRVFANLFK